MMSICYYNGVGANEDKTEGVKWLRKAVEQGQEKAIDFLRQIDRAANEISTLHTKAERGDVEAQILLIDYYSDGIAVPPNYEEALKWLRKAAEQGNAHAQYLLGAIYYRGEYVSQNYAETVRWFRRAAEQGHEKAIDVLRQMDNAPAPAIDAGATERAAHFRVFDAYRQVDVEIPLGASQEERITALRSYHSNLLAINLRGCSSEFRSDFIALINSVDEFIAALEHLSAFGESLPDGFVDVLFTGIVNYLGGEDDAGFSRMQNNHDQAQQRLRNACYEWRRAETTLKKYE